MSDTPPEFDLKFLPDWLKAEPTENRYANYQGESERPRRGDRDDRRGPRPGGGGGNRPGGPRPPAGGDRRGPRPGGGGPQGGGPRREGGGGGGGPRGRDSRDSRQDDRYRAPQPPLVPANVRIEFLPEPSGAQSIGRQVKQSSRAYPLFSTGRLFLERPERHRIRITSLDASVPLFQLGEGPISFDRAIIERNAFRDFKTQYYTEETIQGEPLKGNYTNVARTRGGGAYLGPTNYHGYQPALRKIYEERYSRRMSFQEFTQREIEILTDEKSINDWKEQARSTTTFTTTQEAEPIVFKSAFDAEQHFRKHYLPQLVKTGTSLVCPGPSARLLPDRNLGLALRDAWEKERGFPAQLVNSLRPYLLEAGLHFFKHRKRVLYISAIKPSRVAPGQDMSAGLSAILKAIEESPKLTRRELAVKIMGENHEAPELLEQKAQLARDLHYLVHAGHVIEFHDGTLDLPLVPGAAQQPPQQKGQKQKQGAPTQTAVEDAEEGPEEGPEEIVEGIEEGAEAESTETLVSSSVDVTATTEAFTAETAAAGHSSATLSTETPGADIAAVEQTDLPPSLEHASVSEETPSTFAATPVEVETGVQVDEASDSLTAREEASIPASESLVSADAPTGSASTETMTEAPEITPAEATSVSEGLRDPNA